MGSSSDVEQEGLEDAGHQVSFTWSTPVTAALPPSRHGQCEGQTTALWASAGWEQDTHEGVTFIQDFHFLQAPII